MQLAIFIRGITDNFDVIKEFAELIPMKGTTRGEDIAQAIVEYTGRMQLDLSKFVSATTVSAPAMIGSHKGAIAVLQNNVSFVGIFQHHNKTSVHNSSGSFGLKAELDISKRVSVSRHIFECLGLVSVLLCQCLVSVSDLESLGKWSCLNRDPKNFGFETAFRSLIQKQRWYLPDVFKVKHCA